MYRFQETGLWTQSPPSHFLPASRASAAPPVFSLSLPAGTHITQQLHSLAGALPPACAIYLVTFPNPFSPLKISFAALLRLSRM